MKIAILNSLYERGGAESVMRKMATDLKNQNQEVFFIITKSAKEKKPDYGTDKIYTLNSLYSDLAQHSYIRRLFWHLINIINLNKYYQVKRILKQEKPDIVVSHNLMGLGFLIPRLIRRLKINHEHYLHDIQLLHPSGLMFYGSESIISSPAAKIYQMVTKYLFKPTPYVISPSKWLLNLYLEKGFFKNAEKIVMSCYHATQSIKEKNGDDHDNHDKNISDIKNQEKQFIFVGQVEEYKGVLFLIQAWKEAQTKGKLKIIGTGSALAKAKKIVNPEKDNIEFLGHLSQKEVSKIMSTSKALIVPSLVYENSPAVIHEAKEQNLSIIAAHLGGIPELIGPQDGQLFAPGDKQALIDILHNLK